MLTRFLLLITFGVFFLATVHFSQKTIFSSNPLPQLLASIQSKTQTLGASVKTDTKNNTPRSLNIKSKDSYLDLKSDIDPNEISAQQALVYDVSRDKIIYAKDIYAKHAIASLTKVATFMVAVENTPLDSVVTISEQAAAQEPDSMGLFPGEKLTVKQLLEGMILVSGNDSAEAIAENTFGPNSRSTFIQKMNDKAYYLGMDETHFVNPNGLDEDSGSGQSSSFDLMLLMKEALKSPVFMEISASREIQIPENFLGPENHKNFYLGNTSPTIDYPGYIAGKPGFTYDAGKCQITVADQNGRKYMAIILASNDRKVDTEKLLNWAFGLP